MYCWSLCLAAEILLRQARRINGVSRHGSRLFGRNLQGRRADEIVEHTDEALRAARGAP
jgi:hypothetical protein